jgi:hypothetical protein
MKSEHLKKLEEAYHEFIVKHNELRRATNEKQRKKIKPDIDFIKERMIEDYDLMQYDLHVKHYSHDNDLFKRDVGEIIEKIKKNLE